MRFFKVLLMSLVILALAVPLFAAGGDGEVAAEGEMVISWLGKPPAGGETTAGIEYVYEKTGIRVVPNMISLRDGDKINVMMAAGEFPDFGQLPGGQTIIQYYYDEITRSVPLSMIREFTPGYVKKLDQYPDVKLMDRNPDNPEEYIALHGFWEQNLSIQYFGTFRVDLAKNVGYELPGNYDAEKVPLDSLGKVYYYDYDMPLQELEDLLIKFRDGDADGNGKIDSIPMAAFGAGSNQHRVWGQFMGAFGVGSNTNVEINGKLVEWNIHPGYKDFLKLMAKWYDMDLIDKEFMNDNRAKWFEKLNAGLAMYNPGANKAVPMGSMLDRPPMGAISEDDVANGAEYVFLPPIVGPDGHQGNRMLSLNGSPVNERLGVGFHVDDKKLEAILTVLQVNNYGANEDWINCWRGVPGVHFKWEGEPFKSRAQSVPQSEIPDGYPVTHEQFLQWPPRNYFADRMKFMYYPEGVSWYNDFWWKNFEGKGVSIAYKPYRYDFMTETELPEVQRKYGTTMNTIRDTFFLKAVTGQVNIDAEWDNHVAEWLKNGGQLYLDELGKAPIASEFMKGNIVY